MRRVIKYAGMFLLVAAAAAISVNLPGIIMDRQDSSMLGKIHLEVSEDVLVESQQPGQMLLIQKLRMLGADSYQGKVSSIILAQGKNLTAESAAVQCADEIGEMEKYNIIPEEYKHAEWTILPESIEIQFVISTAEPDQYFIIWFIQAQSDYGDLYITMDDETGRILRLTCNWLDYVEMGESRLGIIAKGFGDYLGMEYLEEDENKISGDTVVDLDKKEKYRVYNEASEYQDRRIVVTYRQDNREIQCTVSKFYYGYSIGYGVY